MDPAASTRPPRKRTITRVVAAVVVWLVMGSALNVAVAWGIMVRHASAKRPDVRESVESKDWGTLAWPPEAPTDWSAPTFSFRRDYRGRSVIELCNPPVLQSLTAVESGWPVFAVRGVVIDDFTRDSRITRPLSVLVVDLVNGGRPPNLGDLAVDHGLMIAFLPTHPLWPGFALNTLFYAAIAWGLWRIPILIRRHRRRTRGLCVNCAYNRAGLAPGALCPECGHALTPLLSAAS